jgi:hypothetical protein
MTLKQEVVSELGDDELLAPDLIARSLVANDQVKYYFALLQTARDNTDRPQIPAPDLKAERIASEIPDDRLDDVVMGTKKDHSGAYLVPQGPDLLRRIRSSIETMPMRMCLEWRPVRIGQAFQHVVHHHIHCLHDCLHQHRCQTTGTDLTQRICVRSFIELSQGGFRPAGALFLAGGRPPPIR